MKPVYFHSTQDIYNNIVLKETRESIFLEFKKSINLKNKQIRNDLALEFASDICQFANTLGGAIIIGVDEVKSQITGLSVANNYINVCDLDDIREFFNDRVRNYYYPSSINYDIVPIEIESHLNLLAINVYPLINNLACTFTPSSPVYMKFPYRTEFGKKYLKPFEVEEKMNNRNRRLYLQLSNIWQNNKEVIILSPVIVKEKDPKLQWDNRDLNILISELYNNEFQLRINNQAINIPYGLLKEVWTTYDEKIGVIIDATISISSDRKNIELVI